MPNYDRGTIKILLVNAAAFIQQLIENGTVLFEAKQVDDEYVLFTFNGGY